MSQIPYILFGWVLGLIGPVIVDSFRLRVRKREIGDAIRVELEDLQFRLAICSFLLLQSHGQLDREFMVWFQSVTDKYSGNEPVDATRRMISKLLTADEETIKNIAKQLRSKEGIGSSLKTFQASFLESHLTEISRCAVSVQRKIHEFRNQLAIINQDTLKANDLMKMTFNQSLGEGNLTIVKTELKNIYNYIQRRTKNAADKIDLILSKI